MKKITFRAKFQPFFLKCPKVRPLFEFLFQAFPKVQENKVFWIDFSKMESAVMSVVSISFHFSFFVLQTENIVKKITQLKCQKNEKTNVPFISYFRLLVRATKIPKIGCVMFISMCSVFAFCKARWARQK